MAGQATRDPATQRHEAQRFSAMPARLLWVAGSKGPAMTDIF